MSQKSARMGIYFPAECTELLFKVAPRIKLCHGHTQGPEVSNQRRRRGLVEEGSREVSREGPASCSFHTEVRGNIILDLTRVDSATASPQGSMGSNIHWDLASEQAES